MTRRPLTAADREEISRGIGQGLQQDTIAAQIGRSPSVVSREIRRHGGRDGYRAVHAHRQAQRARRRPKTRKLDRHRRLREHVLTGLRRALSPDQIAGRLRREYGHDDAEAVVSHEAIYTWIYALPKGELARHGIELRSGRTRRQPRGRRRSSQARIVGMRSIDERPTEVEGRAVPGHWEGDLLIGKDGATAVATLVERTSRFYVPVPLAFGKSAETVCDAMIEAVTEIPKILRRSVTWDQGTEMARHESFTVATETPVYFAHPHSPWERGTNENTNRLLREYFPKSTAITADAAYHKLVAAELNARPRRILDYRTPAEVFAELLTSPIANTD